MRRRIDNIGRGAVRVTRYLLLTGFSTFALSSIGSAAILPMTGATVSPAGTTVTGTTILTSYTTSAGAVNDLSHAISGNGSYNTAGGGSTVDNVWAEGDTEIDGPLAAANLDISRGVVNAGDNNDPSITDIGATGSSMSQYFFSQVITGGVAGDGNDFFLIELNGNDSLTIRPLDASGTAIGSFALTVAGADWGGIGIGVKRVADSFGPSANLSPLAGLAFDYEDFDDGAGGTLAGLYGIGWEGTTGLDAVVVGVNSNLAPVPEPASAMLVGLCLLIGFTACKRDNQV